MAVYGNPTFECIDPEALNACLPAVSPLSFRLLNYSSERFLSPCQEIRMQSGSLADIWAQHAKKD
jgi:hypothetical protein